MAALAQTLPRGCSDREFMKDVGGGPRHSAGGCLCAFDVGGADLIGRGSAATDFGMSADALGRRIAALGDHHFLGAAVFLDELREVDLVVERVIDFAAVRLKAVRGQLEGSLDALLKVLNVTLCSHRVALADFKIDDELRVSVNAQVGVLVAKVADAVDVILFFAVDEGKHLIHLDKLEGMIADALIHQPGALLAGHFEHVKHGVTMDLGEPFNGADADALNEHVNDLNRLVKREPQRV